jgi:hypothetical protein
MVVVLLENGRRNVGEAVGGHDPGWAKALDYADSPQLERQHRTQEVAGSNPATSIKPPQRGGFFVGQAFRLSSRRSKGTFGDCMPTLAALLRCGNPSLEGA